MRTPNILNLILRWDWYMCATFTTSISWQPLSSFKSKFLNNFTSHFLLLIVFLSATTLGFLSEPHLSGFSHESPSSQILSFQPGEMIYVKKIYDRGIYNGKSEEEGPTFQYSLPRLVFFCLAIPMTTW